MSRGCAATDDELDRLRNEALANQKPAASRTNADNKPKGSWGRAAAATSGYKGEEAQDPAASSSAAPSLCGKCKERPSDLLLRGTEPACAPCLKDLLETQCLKSLRGSRLVATGDRVLVAVSGGACSRAVLGLLAQYRSVNRDRPERNKIFFDLGAVHIDESALPDTYHEASSRMAAAVAGPGIPLWTVPLECALLRGDLSATLSAAEASPAADELRAVRAELQTLVEGVEDETGREDLVRYLRERLLLRVGAALGFNRVARGDSATLCAVRVIAESCKGRGYALPGEVQFLDARADAAASSSTCFILPARELLDGDLALYCGVRALPFADAPPAVASKSNINRLCATFVTSLQRNHSAMVSTILKTASKLQAFDFNDPRTAPASTGASAVPDALKKRGGKPAPESTSTTQPVASKNSAFALQDYAGFCLVCRAPFSEEEAGEPCCESCRVQMGGQLGRVLEVFMSTHGAPLKKMSEAEMRADLDGLLLDDW